MNANEMADAMEIRAEIRRKATTRKSVQENANDRLADQLEQAATMLRQQQAEIEALRMGFAGNGTSDSELAEVRAMANRWFLEIQALKQVIDANNLIQNIGQFVKPANEPVAWGWYDLEIKRFFPHWDEDLMENKEGCIPLYTHPAKTLTDEEINALSEEHLDMDWQTGVIDFARAILRKAQEK